MQNKLTWFSTPVLSEMSKYAIFANMSSLYIKKNLILGMDPSFYFVA